MPDSFLQRVLQAARFFRWIQRIEHETVGKVARLRLFLDTDRFVAVYHNAETGSTSYAYIESGQRLFGANNMKIGWHIHPWDDETSHVKSQPFSPEEFLGRLEKALSDHGKL